MIKRLRSLLFTTIVVNLLMPTWCLAQHQLIRGSDAPGILAFKRLIAEPGIANYDQPVNVVVPDDGDVSFWNGGGFSHTQIGQTLIGMRVGPVYRFKTAALIRGQIVTVFPTVEMLDRLYPPEGLSLRHPVDIVITAEDIDDANAGNLVTKVIYLEDPDTALPYRLKSNQQASIEVGRGQDPFEAADRLGRPMAIVRVGSRQPSVAHDASVYHTPIQLFAGDTQNTSLQQNGICGVGCSCTSCQSLYTCCPDEIANLPKSRRDEYVCDGNDRKLKVVAGIDWELHGLDIEDTVAHFDTLDGKVKVAPSNRVCIYSPRFASVRRLLQSNQETITQKLNVVNDKTVAISRERTERSSSAQQNIQVQLNKLTQRPNAFRDRTRGVVADNTVKLLGTRHFFKPFEDFHLIRFGRYSSAEQARLSLGMQSAIAWNSDVRVQIAGEKQQPVIVNDVYQLQEIVSIESDTHPDLRLCKLASTASAKSGETVDFTIRFDNIGRERIGNVTVIDNLSPRLEYIEDSAECSVKAEFKTEANEAGSLTLRWEISDVVNVSEGGIIRFQCRVR